MTVEHASMLQGTVLAKPHSSNTYAGYFDGGVHVNGNLYTNMILSNEFGTGWSLQADGSYTYKKKEQREQYHGLYGMVRYLQRINWFLKMEF